MEARGEEREGELTREGREKMQASEARKRLISRRGRKGPEQRKEKLDEK